MRHRTWAVLIAVAATVPVAAAPAAHLARRAVKFVTVNDAQNRGAAINYGYGPGVKPSKFRQSFKAGVATAIVPGGPQAGTIGTFGPTIPWPIIPIHEVLLPDGRVMSFGSNPDGNQTGQFVYDVWNPALGTDTNAHLTLPNTTRTDIFCAGQIMMWMTGETLITGGDLTIDGARNYSNSATTIFSPASNTIRAAATMEYPRWYNSTVPLAKGEFLALGGRSDPATSVITPEVYNPWTGWRTLTGAASADAFGDSTYPRGFVGPDGKVFVLGIYNQYKITTDGTGTITQVGGEIPTGDITLPTVMFAPGKLLSVRLDNNASYVIDFNRSNPTWTFAGTVDQSRIWSSSTVMADGKVLLIGGSSTANSLIGATYTAELWDPQNPTVWMPAATAANVRLYHSNALLLPDATVLTSGGGAPGPVSNLNGEIYYPPYLYHADGSVAVRPTLTAAPPVFTWYKPLPLTVGAGNVISRVTVVRAGSTTHSVNLDQRFIDLPFTQVGSSVSVTMPGDWYSMLPGNWMVFVWQNGVPSVAKTVLVPS